MNDLIKDGSSWAVIVAMAGYVLLIEKRHRDEREEWRKQSERQNDEANRNIKENTSILSSLKTILENKR